MDYLLASGTAGVYSRSTGATFLTFDLGSLSALFTNPIWVVKTRMLSTGRAHPNAYNSLSHGLVSLLQAEGPRGLLRGMVPALFGVTHGAVYFMFYEKLKLWRLQKRRGDMQGIHLENKKAKVLTNWDYLTLSALSKVLAGTLTYPYQVIRARLQTYDAGQQYNSARDVVAQIWRMEGARGFYKG